MSLWHKIDFQVPKVTEIDLLYTQLEDWKKWSSSLWKHFRNETVKLYASHFDSSARASEVRSKLDGNAYPRENICLDYKK